MKPVDDDANENGGIDDRDDLSVLSARALDLSRSSARRTEFRRSRMSLKVQK